MRTMRRLALAIAVALLAAPLVGAEVAILLPNAQGSVKFAVIGDNGTGKDPQYEVGQCMAEAQETFAFDFVLMLGDNFYGSQRRPEDRARKFEEPYGLLLERGVRFFAALGNHDDESEIWYPPFNMQGRRYYTFTRPGVRFFVLDSNALDPEQLAWFEQALTAATEPWKVAYFHHPLYGNAGRHGSNYDLRVLLEPLLVRHGVRVVFSGHDHVYERLVPQQGVHYFVAGSGGQLRTGDVEPSPDSAAAFDTDRAFMIVEIAGDVMTFQTIARTGVTVDHGRIARVPATSLAPVR